MTRTDVDLSALRPPPGKLDDALWEAQSRAASLNAAFRAFASLVVDRDPRAMEMAAAVVSGEAAFPPNPEAAARAWYPVLARVGALDALGDAPNFAVAEFDDPPVAVIVQRIGHPSPFDHLAELADARAEITALRAQVRGLTESKAAAALAVLDAMIASPVPA